MADEVSVSAESLALAKKRHAKAEAELDRGVSAYLAGAMDMKLYKREQERLQEEIRTAEAEIKRAEATDSPSQHLFEAALNVSAPQTSGTSPPTPTSAAPQRPDALTDRDQGWPSRDRGAEAAQPRPFLCRWRSCNGGGEEVRRR